jgi:hypothetical protein
MIRKTFVVLLLASLGAAQSKEKEWAAVERLERQEGVAASLRDGRVVRGRLEKWRVDAMDLSTTKGVEHFARQDVSAVRVEKRGSRKKGALWGAVIGFGIAFPIGVAAAGNLTDRNNPTASTRVGMGAGFGLLGAGIGAGLGSLTGGSHIETIYRAK